jgi:phosphomevalonate kinase
VLCQSIFVTIWACHSCSCRGPDVAEQPNTFVETSLFYAFSYVRSVDPTNKNIPNIITILADNDYYSQTSVEKSNARFATFDTPIYKANKTGLGSSAALVTALVGAILVFCLPAGMVSLTTETGKRRLHNLAQAAHCAAQGKVGSGFDVASAVYGSCIYRRFSPSILQNLGDEKAEDFQQKLKSVVEETGYTNWDTEIIKEKVTIPKGLRLVMCDVDCGSKTPGMVKQLLKWRKEHADVANKLWEDLQATNDELATELVRLSATDGKDDYSTLRQILQHNRKLVRTMSNNSDVPVEPEAQTKLLDACSEIDGVIGGVTPGAGGFDADVLLIKDDPDVLSRLESMLKEYKFVVEGAETPGSGRVGLLGVREEMEGVRQENVDGYRQWR